MLERIEKLMTKLVDTSSIESFDEKFSIKFDSEELVFSVADFEGAGRDEKEAFNDLIDDIVCYLYECTSCHEDVIEEFKNLKIV